MKAELMAALRRWGAWAHEPQGTTAEGGLFEQAVEGTPAWAFPGGPPPPEDTDPDPWDVWVEAWRAGMEFEGHHFFDPGADWMHACRAAYDERHGEPKDPQLVRYPDGRVPLDVTRMTLARVRLTPSNGEGFDVVPDELPGYDRPQLVAVLDPDDETDERRIGAPVGFTASSFEPGGDLWSVDGKLLEEHPRNPAWDDVVTPMQADATDILHELHAETERAERVARQRLEEHARNLATVLVLMLLLGLAGGCIALLVQLVHP